MKTPTSILKYLLPVIVLGTNFQNVLSQNCPFTTNFQPISLAGEDINDGTIPLFSEDTGLVVVDVRIGNDGTPATDPPGSLLTAVRTPPDGNIISIFAKKPDFGVAPDYYGFTSGSTELDSQSLQIVVEGANGRETRVCGLALTIHDTNNLAPQFNTSTQNLDVEFTVTTAWDKKGVALNWKFDDWIYVTDWDRTKVEPTLIIEPNEINITGKLTEMPDKLEHANVWRVELFVYGDLVEESYAFSIKADDGVNIGPALNVVLNVEEEDLFEPVFTSEVYYSKLDKMPEVGEPLDITPECIDPDDLMNGRSSVFEYELTSDDGVAEYLDFEGRTNVLKFKNEVPLAHRGKTVKATIKATKVGADPETSKQSQLELTFPLPSKIKFETNIKVEHLPTWPEANEYDIPIPEATGELGIGIAYKFGESRPPPDGVILLGDKVIQFIADVTPDMLGELEENRVMIFDIVVTYPGLQGYPHLDDVITIVLTFPRVEGTTDNPTTGTTELTTECSCGTTEITEITCPTELPVTPCDCESTTPPDCMTTPECPQPTTCEPCGVTGNPTTEYGAGSTEGCDCGTTEVSDVTCATSSADPSTGGTSEEPCDSSCPTPEPCDDSNCPTPEPCDDSNCPTPAPCDDSNCPTPAPCETICPTPAPCDDSNCPTPAPCETTCPTPAPCETTCPTPAPCDCDSSPTCPTPEPCDCPNPCEPLDDEDCSTTGLVVAVIATSILCACSILAGGYCLWLLRKATLDPTKIARDSLSRPDVSLTPSPPTDPEVNAGDDYTTPHRFSFGDGNEYSSGSRFGVLPSSGGVEPGFANPNFTNDMGGGVVDPVPVNAQPSSETKQRRKSSIKPPKDIEPDYEESPKKSNMKTPKEIEPDYEEIVSAPEPVLNDSGKQSRVLFAPEDEYISVDGGSNEVVVGGGSDVEDERL